MKRISIILSFILVSIAVMGQGQGRGLIKPIVESPPMSKKQANAFKSFQEFRNWGIERVGLDSIIKQGYTGKGIKVCVCDTGKPYHVGLKGKIAAWSNFTVDAHSNDNNGHSTHVAGIINEIAPDARLYFAKVLADDGWGSDRGIADGILWCGMQGVDIINLSLGGPDPSPEIKAAIDAVLKDTILFVAAVGNEGDGGESVDNVGYPAKYSEVLSVGSINYDFGVSYFSSAGAGGDIVAPGSKIISMWGQNQYIALSGTSMATPFVSGVGALMREKYGKDDLAEEMVKRTASDLVPEGYDRKSFWGKVSPQTTFAVPTEEEMEGVFDSVDVENPIDTGGNVIDSSGINPIDSIDGGEKDSTGVDDFFDMPESFDDMSPEQTKWVLISMGVLLVMWLLWKYVINRKR